MGDFYHVPHDIRVKFNSPHDVVLVADRIKEMQDAVSKNNALVVLNGIARLYSYIYAGVYTDKTVTSKEHDSGLCCDCELNNYHPEICD